MRINQNIPALTAYRALTENQGGVNTAMERLSSGLRINRAADDAAGLAISETMRAQVNGLDQAQRNTLEGIDLLRTAEGGLDETHAVLQRMRTLAVQAANGVNSTDQLQAIQAEMMQLRGQIDDIAFDTGHNGQTLLDGTFRDKVFQVGANAGDTELVTIASGNTPPVPAKPAGIALWDVDQRLGGLASPVTVTQQLTTAGTTTTASVTLNPLPTSTGELVQRLNADPQFSTSFTAALGQHNTATVTNTDANVIITAKTPGAGSISVSGIQSDPTLLQTRDGKDEVPGHRSGGYSAAEILGTIDVTREAGSATSPGGTYTSPPGDNTGFGTQDHSGGGTYTIPPSTSTWPSGANDAIAQIDRAIAIVSRGRAEIGAIHNGFEHTARNLGVASENLTLAESRIRDADMAKEVTDLRRWQILCQSSMSMLAQANQIPQTVLKLLQ